MDLGIERLRALLERGVETEELDYKSTWDISSKPALLEICKDIAAMEAMPSGGHLVIGADDDGAPSGLFDEAAEADFDEQRVRSRVVAILGEPLALGVAFHRVGEHSYLLIRVEPHVDGYRIMSTQRGYDRAGQQHVVWNEGDVLVRRGTSSVKWNQHEARATIERVVASRKEAWRSDIYETMRARSPVFDQGGYVDLSVPVPLESFEGTVLEVLRRQDYVGLSVLLRRLRSQTVRALGDAGDEEARSTQLNNDLSRLDVLAATSARHGHQATYEACLRAYVDIYARIDAMNPIFALGHEQVLMHAYALGAALLREERWSELSALARLKPIDTSNGYWRTLLRKAEVTVARARVGEDDSGGRIGVIDRAKVYAERLFSLLDEYATSDEVANSLLQFDFSRGIATTSPGEQLGAYTNFAFYYTARIEPLVLRLIEEPGVRGALFGGTDAELKKVLQAMDKAAREQAFMFNAWEGFNDPRILHFLGEDLFR